jgi:1-acyl-sn-glycerol-3-phosphate acyltransferase
MLPRRYRLRLAVQRHACILLRPIFYTILIVWMRLVRGYRLRDLAGVRRRYRSFRAQHPGPIVLCPNHLTQIDSVLTIWALVPWWRSLFTPSWIAWNIPERRNFSENYLFRAICYVGKCIPIERRAPPEETRLQLDKIQYLLSQGETFMIFVEGTRSRTGRIDLANFAYGVGRILLESPQAKVLCIYLRGEGQEIFSDFPRKGEVLDVQLEMLTPHAQHSGLRGAREIATQIVHKLAEMEEQHFALKDTR